MEPVSPSSPPSAPSPLVPVRPRRLPARAYLRRVGPLVATCGLLAYAASAKLATRGVSRAEVLVSELAKQGISARADEVVWVDGPDPAKGSRSAFASFATSRAIVRATPAPPPGEAAADEAEPADLFLVETRLSPTGVLLEVGGAYNLTETAAADESRPVVAGSLVAYLAEPLVEGARTTVGVLDLRGETKPYGDDWTRTEKLQQALTYYQQTGQRRGVGKAVYALETSAGDRLTLRIEAGQVKVTVGEQEATLAAGAALPAWVRPEERELSRPGNLTTWAVDRVRTVIGDERMQAIKQVAFTLKDYVDRGKETVSTDTGEADIAQDLGQDELSEPTRAEPTDPELGWPPAPLEAWITPALPGEGQWNSLEKDSFLRRNPGVPMPLVTTFIRSDRSKKVTRVYVALWDPRQVELHMMAGSVEPKSATGEAGPGRIPRTPEVMKRVIAASNAGFQALHGEFGMMADGVVYLPPKPYAATVGVTRDGTTFFGSWPNDATIPEEVRSYRQNMTVMVQDMKFNPYGRTWWGGAVPGAEDKVHTVRTGICLTKERFVAYLYGVDLSPEALAQAMIQTRCIYGLALDMNAGHAGMEIYKVGPADEVPPLGRPLSRDWEAEGEVNGMPGWRFQGRRLIRGMGLMNFPRYIRPESRDFFYMTLRPMLPGVPLAPASGQPQAGEGEWRVKGLPQHGFPYAMALTEVRALADDPSASLRVWKLDPRTVAAQAADAPPGDAKTVAVLPSSSGSQSVWHTKGAFSVSAEAPVAGALRVMSGEAPGTQTAQAAVGITDDDGMLVYVEAPKPVAASSLAKALERAGASQALVLAAPLSVALGGDTDLAGKATRAPTGAGAVRLVRVESPGAKRSFESTPVVPFNTWYPLQQHRVRYFKKPQQ